MSDFKVIDQRLGVWNVSETKTFATSNIPIPLGQEFVAADINTGTANVGAGVFKFVRGSDVASRGQLVQLQGNSAVALAAGASNSVFPIGLAAGVLSATNVYGFVQIRGLADYGLGTNVSIAAGAPLFINAGTAGLVQSASVAGNRIDGVNLWASYTSSQSLSMSVQIDNARLHNLTLSV